MLPRQKDPYSSYLAATEGNPAEHRSLNISSRQHHGTANTTTSAIPFTPSRQLLDDIRETEELVREFKKLKETGGTREERKRLEEKVARMKAQQAAAIQQENQTLHHLNTSPSKPRSRRFRGPTTPPPRHADPNASLSPNTSPIPPRQHLLASPEKVPTPTPEQLSEEQVRYWRSVTFAIVLAESHTRKEIYHKWERRLLRALAAFKEEKVRIELQPSARQELTPVAAAPAVPRTSEQPKPEEEAAKPDEEEVEARRRAEEEEAEAKRRATEEAEARRKADEEAEARRKAEEEAEAKRRAEEEKAKAEEEAKRKAEEEEAEAKRQAEEARRIADEEEEAEHRAAEEAEAKRKAEEEAEAEARRKAEEETEAKRRAGEEEAEAKRKAEEEETETKRKAEEDARRKAEEEAEAERKAEEEAKRIAEAEAEAKRKTEEEAEARRKAEEEEAKRKAEEEAEAAAKREEEKEAKRRAEEETEAKRKAEEEAEARRKAEEEEAQRKAEEEAEAKRIAEEEEAKRKAEEAEAEAKRKAEEEAEARRKAEEEAEAEEKRKAEEEAKRNAEEEAEARRKAEEEAEARRVAEEAEAKRIAEEKEAEAAAKRRAEEEDAERIAEEEATKESTTVPPFAVLDSLAREVVDDALTAAAKEYTAAKEPTQDTSEEDNEEKVSSSDSELSTSQKSESLHQQEEPTVDTSVVWNALDSLSRAMLEDFMAAAAESVVAERKQKEEEQKAAFARQVDDLLQVHEHGAEEIEVEEEESRENLCSNFLEQEKQLQEQEKEQEQPQPSSSTSESEEEEVPPPADHFPALSGFADKLIEDCITEAGEQYSPAVEEKDEPVEEEEEEKSEPFDDDEIEEKNESVDEEEIEETSEPAAEEPESAAEEEEQEQEEPSQEKESSVAEAESVKASYPDESEEEEGEERPDVDRLLAVADSIVDDFLRQAAEQVRRQAEQEEKVREEREDLEEEEAQARENVEDDLSLQENEIREREEIERLEIQEREHAKEEQETEEESAKEAQREREEREQEVEEEEEAVPSQEEEEEDHSSEEEEEEGPRIPLETIVDISESILKDLVQQAITEAAKEYAQAIPSEVPEDASSIPEEEEEPPQDSNRSSSAEEEQTFSPVEKEIVETEPSASGPPFDQLVLTADHIIREALKGVQPPPPKAIKEEVNAPTCAGPNMYDDSKSLFDISNSAPVGNAINKNSPNREGSPPLHSIAKPAAPRDIKEVPTNTNNAYLSIDNRISKVMTTYILEKAGEDVGQHSHNSGELSRAVVERTLQEGLTKAIEAYQGDKPGDNSVIPLFCKVAIISLSEYVAEDFSIFVSRRHLEKVNQLNTQSDTLLTEEEEAQSVQELFTTELSPQRLLSPACLSASNVHNLTMALLDMARKGCDRDADGAVRVHPLLKNRENLFTSSSTTVGTPRHKNDGTSGNGRRAALNALVLSQCIDNITDLLVGDTVDWLFDSLRNGQLVKK